MDIAMLVAIAQPESFMSLSEIDGELIRALSVVRNPDKLRHPARMTT
jgi:hypothetical protein